MTHGASDALRPVIEPLVVEAGFDLEELAVVPAGRRRLVRIVIDSDSGIDLDAAAELSTAVSARLDAGPADDVFGDAAYTLEVTSPGIGRPLTLPRHFRRAIGRQLHITTADGTSRTGRLRRLDGETLVLLGGPSGLDETTIELPEIRRAVVEVEFTPVPAAVAAVLAADAADVADADVADADVADADVADADVADAADVAPAADPAAAADGGDVGDVGDEEDAR